MAHVRAHPRRNAFTLIELLVVIAVIALLIGILLPSLGEARRSGRTTICLSNMKELGTATQSYTADYQDKLYAFTISSKTASLLTYPDLIAQAAGAGNNALEAHSAQAIDIIRRRTGRDAASLPQINGWIPDVLYTHLVLQDYLASRLPEKLVVCPEDRNRNLWQSDPIGFMQGAFNPAPNPLSPRWPYSSTYEHVYCHYAPDRCDNGPGVTQATAHNLYYFVNPTNVTDPGAYLGRRKVTEISFLSQKVQMYDLQVRHRGKAQFYYGYADAVAPLLFYDASVRVLRTGPARDPLENGVTIPIDANSGWDPSTPNSTSPLMVQYTPAAWETPIRGGGSSVSLPGFYRWSRRGLKGVDYGGTEPK
ncbi:MAG: type II secretion system protein [Planctomycetes bacterium]|nr:type II secretion system protein [Planctomycetota bacterium]